MKKRFLAIAIAAGIASPFTANAAEVYGVAHLAIIDQDTAAEIDIQSYTSAIGVKGKEDLGGGLSAIFKIEFDVNMDNGEIDDRPGAPTDNNISGRDQYVGLKGGWGSVILGTANTNYKMTGAWVDPIWRMPGEGRLFTQTMSGRLHAGKGIQRGRSTDMLQYKSPKFGGNEIVFNYTMDGASENVMGLGWHLKTKNVKFFLDYIDDGTALANAGESAMKVGGAFTFGSNSTVSLQYESAEDLTGADYALIAWNQGIGAKNAVALTYGYKDGTTDATSGDGMTLSYMHDISKRTSWYALWADYSADTVAVGNADDDMITLGIKHTF